MTIAELMQETHTPALTADHHGTIRYINAAFEIEFGWTSADLVGKPLATIIPKNMRDAHHLGFSRFLVTGHSTILNQPLKLKIVKKNRDEWLCEHVITAEKQNEEWVFGALFRPL